MLPYLGFVIWASIVQAWLEDCNELARSKLA
jgi:hypothetical protein